VLYVIRKNRPCWIYNYWVEKTLEVIVPVHNIHDRRDGLLKLLSMNPLANVSFIVVSDSMFDGDHSQVQKIVSASLNPNSKVVTGNFRSPGLARNAGLSVAEARWVAFLDSDDQMHTETLLELIANTEEESAQLGIGGIILDSRDSETELTYFMNPNISIFANLSLTPAFTRIVYQRILLREVTFTNFKMAEDQCFLIDVLELNPKIYLEEIYFYTYNLGDAGQSTRNRDALRDLPLAITYITSKLGKVNPEMHQLLITVIIRLTITYLLSNGWYPKKNLVEVIQNLAVISFWHPVKVAGSLLLILRYRPKSFL